MEICRTRYSRVKIDDDLEIEQSGWREFIGDPEGLVELSGFKEVLKFDLVITPLSKNFFRRGRVVARILPARAFCRTVGELDLSVWDEERSFPEELSDLLVLELPEGGNIAVVFFDRDLNLPIRLFPSRIRIIASGKVDVVEIWDCRSKISVLCRTEFEVIGGSEVNFLSLESFGGSVAIQKKTFTLGSGARLKTGRILGGGSRFFSFDDFRLVGEGGFCSLADVIVGLYDRVVEVNAKVEHIGAGTTGYVHVRSVLHDSSWINYVGGAKIGRNAVNSDSYVELRALKLSSSSRVHYVPFMEIDTNLARAKHASSVSRIGDDEMFYLNSRGLDEKASRQLIVDGFLGEVLKLFPSFPGVSEIIPKHLFPFLSVWP